MLLNIVDKHFHECFNYYCFLRSETTFLAFFSFSPSVLVCLGCYDKIPDWVAYKQQRSISHCSGEWKSKIRVQARSGEGPPLGCRLPTSCCVLTWWKRARDVSGASFMGALIPFMKVLPS